MLFVRLMRRLFKQKTAYEMRISVWSSDVGSSDLADKSTKNQALFSLRAAVLAPLSVAAFTPQAYAKTVYVGVDGGNIAVSGYDAVSYFEGDGVPVKGEAAFAVDRKSVV